MTAQQDYIKLWKSIKTMASSIAQESYVNFNDLYNKLLNNILDGKLSSHTAIKIYEEILLPKKRTELEKINVYLNGDIWDTYSGILDSISLVHKQHLSNSVNKIIKNWKNFVLKKHCNAASYYASVVAYIERPTSRKLDSILLLVEKSLSISKDTFNIPAQKNVVQGMICFLMANNSPTKIKKIRALAQKNTWIKPLNEGTRVLLPGRRL